jgi:hypothetical protein
VVNWQGLPMYRVHLVTSTSACPLTSCHCMYPITWKVPRILIRILSCVLQEPWLCTLAHINAVYDQLLSLDIMTLVEFSIRMNLDYAYHYNFFLNQYKLTIHKLSIIHHSCHYPLCKYVMRWMVQVTATPGINRHNRLLLNGILATWRPWVSFSSLFRRQYACVLSKQADTVREVGRSARQVRPNCKA